MLTIDSCTVVEEGPMFGRGMYLYNYIVCFFVNYISTYMLEEQFLEERDPYLDEEEDIIMEDSREYN